jgi:hypothetical protein
MSGNRFPPGWDEERVREVLAHYENESAQEEDFMRIDSARSAADRKPRRSVGRYLTQVVHSGANILGLLELFVFIGCGWAAAELSEAKVLGISLFLVGTVGVLLFDLAWRATQTETHWIVSLFSPFVEGCFCFVPIWLWFTGAGVGGAIVLVLQRMRLN